jgi:hypothetical protein
MFLALEDRQLLVPKNTQDDEDSSRVITSTWHRVRVECISKGQKLRKYQVNLFYGRMDQLTWDPGRIRWPGNTPFMSYNTKQGRELLRKRHNIPNPVEQKWGGILPSSHTLR